MCYAIVMTIATEKRIKINILKKYLASEALSLGRGGIKEVSAISGVYRNSILAGSRKLQDSLHTVSDKAGNHSRIRVEGGGRKPITIAQPGILDELDRLVDPESYGNPENPLIARRKKTLATLRRQEPNIHH